MDYQYGTIKTLDGFILSDEQTDALKQLETEKDNFFVTGKAGTGKSVLLRAFVERARDNKKNVVVLAPTGLAAENAGGETIHSFLEVSTPIMNSQIVDQQEISDETRDAYKSVDIIVIDEVSMVRADYMDTLDAKLKFVRGSAEPFGGVQIIAFGDLFQLPPVVDSKDIGSSMYLRENYPTKFFFGAPVVRDHPFKKIELMKVRRQKDDRFVSMLNNAREGIDKYNTAKYFDKLYTEKSADEFSDSVVVATTKKYVQQINDEHMRALKGNERTYNATINGHISEEYLAELTVDPKLKLKVGAKVMMIKNDREHRWVNGTMGRITAMDDDSLKVKIGQNEYSINQEEWEQYHVFYNKGTKALSQRRIGSVRQFPLKVAYAITVHKSQGQTLDSVVIDFSDNPPFEAGQTYVALSRCKSYEGIVLKSHIKAKDFKVNKTILNYMK